MDIDKMFKYLLGVFVVCILLFTWFFPTINSATALNNSSTLWLGGSNYSWFVPVLVVVIVVIILLSFWKGLPKKGK